MKISLVASLLAAACVAGCSSSAPRPASEAPPEPTPEPRREETPAAEAPPAAELAIDPEPEVEPAEVGVVRSALERNTDPQLSEPERAALLASRVDFAVDLYHAVRGVSGRAGTDIFLSPHSISIALAMTYAGARAQTAAEMKKALGFELPDPRLHTGFAYLDLELARRGKGAKSRDGKPFRLDVANSIWGQTGSSFEAPFLDTLASHYGTGLNVVDFVQEPERSRVAINRWVEDKTERRIKDLVPENMVSSQTRIILVNAVYFDAGWASPFHPAQTKPAPFTKVDGSKVEVSMMNELSERPYVKADGYEAVEMPYDGKELSMLVIAPTKGSFAAFEDSLTGSKVLDILASLETKTLHLFFPKLKTEAAFSLAEPLKALGMRRAFEPGADFSGMSASERLFVSDVVHKTFLEIDERGTVAAAATGVGMMNSSLPPPPPVMVVDRPFIAAIVDRPTKTLLFLGRILEPKL